jgi:uncharacterized protein YdaU (DUF1376 family)
MANPWFPFYWADYERKTSHLSMLEHGAYGELIRRYYMIAGPLPANAQQVHRMCRATNEQERAAIDSCLAQFFNLEADGWHHYRCDEELFKARSISEKRSKSAQIKHSKTDANAPASAPANAQQVHTQSQSHIKPSSLPAFDLPVWVPEKAWHEFVAMRKDLRKPMTPRAKELMIAKLEKFLNKGHDPEKILNRSIALSYTDIYEPESENGTNQRKQSGRVSPQAARDERNIAIFADVLRERHGDSGVVGQSGAAEPGGVSGEGHGSLVAGQPVILPPVGHQ